MTEREGVTRKDWNWGKCISAISVACLLGQFYKK